MVLMSVDLPSPVWPDDTNNDACQPQSLKRTTTITVYVSSRSCNAQSKSRNRKARTDDHDIKLESALEQLVLDLLRDGVETDIRRRTNLLYFNGGHCYELNEGGEKWKTWKTWRGKGELERTTGIVVDGEAGEPNRDKFGL